MGVICCTGLDWPESVVLDSSDLIMVLVLVLVMMVVVVMIWFELLHWAGLARV